MSRRTPQSGTRQHSVVPRYEADLISHSSNAAVEFVESCPIYSPLKEVMIRPGCFLHAAILFLALQTGPAMAEEPRKIAFVDTGNTGRSVTAEALANAYIRDHQLHVAVISRAVDVDPFDVLPEANVVTLLSRRGLDVASHRAVQLTANDVKHADVILTMTAKHRNKVVELYPDAAPKTFILAEYATGAPSDVADAYGKPMEVYVEMVKQVDGYIPEAIAKAVK